MNPNRYKIRFSQTSVNGSEEIIASMKKNGWNGPPIDIVEMPDGISTTIDNTRVVSARQAGINVEANIHSYNNTEDIPRLCRRRVLSFRSVGVQSPTVWSAILRIASAC